MFFSIHQKHTKPPKNSISFPLPKHYLLYHLAPDDAIDALNQGGARQHQLVAQGRTTDGEGEHTVFHRPRGGVLVDAGAHQARPQRQGALLIKFEIQTLFPEHFGDDFAHRFGIGSFHR